MRALITGGEGQLGHALQATVPAGVTILALGRKNLNVADPDSIHVIVKKFRPDVLINAAAFTAVDMAEVEVETAFMINAEAVGHLAACCAAYNCKLVQISTDFVFDGAQSHPYSPSAATAPLSVYGKSKLAGEQAAGADALVVRTSWLHSARGHNFVLTMMRLLAERDTLRVVSDQVGSPTNAIGAARTLWKLIGANASGIYHHSDYGVASWYDFAVAIAEECVASGILQRPAKIVPVGSCDYPLPARRPSYSVLDCSATQALLRLQGLHWRDGLRMTVAGIREIERHD